MKKHTVTKLLAPVGIAGLLLTGCSGTSQNPDGDTPSAVSDTLRVNWGGFPASWEPGSQAMEPGYMRVPYETLVLRQKDGTILPNLATAWEFGEGTKSLTLTLRDDVTFHDGTPFDAAAVKANVEYVRDVVGGQFGGPLHAITAIDVVDDTTVNFTFSRPFSTFLDLLSQRNLPMGSPAAIADGSIKSAPVGTGPWAYDASASITGTKMVFTAFADYWGDKPGFPNIELYAIADPTAAAAAVISGDVDVSDVEEEVLPTLDAAANVDTFNYPAIRNNVVFFDRGEGGVFADVKARQAFCYAFDAQSAADLTGGQTATQHFIEGEFGYNPDITGYETNIDKAKALWAELGNPTVNVDWPAAPFNKQEITVRAENANQLPNVNVTVQELSVPQFVSTWNSGQYPLGIGNHPQITPADWYGSWFSDTAPSNPSKTVSDELKALATDAQRAGSSPDAEQKWQAVLAEISDEALSCSHAIGVEQIAYNSDHVTDVQPAIQVWEQKLVDLKAIKPAN
ncbi:ABC transporter substrate-binding protein [Microbacterium suwonense]|uniref:Solute-binding protein family 5 domain-containing protein n=1 Tax=Microbacterium suwonense TaxID=683047 RepID=A0ABN6X654_9MICO|nr:ABC transporter substrate-binding protein [Microbacterium suwonense]BDZ40092.1 hypothetical protein GCM10025863_27060 [Microbacterium suwonense]